MPTVPFQSYLRLTHTGLKADGSPNTASLIINDLDVGFENQNRKSPVYVPVGGYIDVPLTDRVIYSVMQGTIATFSRLGLLTVSSSSFARDVDNLGGSTGTGIALNAGVVSNVRRIGNVLSFVINAGLDTSGFIVGARVDATGFVFPYDVLNITHTISAFTKGQDFTGVNPLAAIVSVASTGADIPAAFFAGITLSLPDGMTTHLYVSAGNAGGLGMNVRTYFAGDMVLTGALDPDRVLFSPVDMTSAIPNTLGVNANTGFLTFVSTDGNLVPLNGTPTPLAEEITVAKAGASFTSVATAIATILDASPSKPYLVHVAPGLYNEPPFTVPSYVTLEGEGAYLQTTNNLTHFITGSPGAEIARIHLIGPTGSGCATINYEGVGSEIFKIEDTEISGGYYGIWCHPASRGIVFASGVLNINLASCSGVFMRCSDHGEVRGTGITYRQDTPAPSLIRGWSCEGPDAYMVLDEVAFKDAGCQDVFFCDGGSYFRISNGTSSAGIRCIHVGPTGNTILNALGMVIRDTHTTDLQVDSPTATVQFSGTAHRSKISVVSGTNIIANFSDEAGGSFGGQYNVGEFYLGSTVGDEVPVRDWLWYSTSTGLADGGEVTRNVAGGLKLDVAEGECFISPAAGAGIREIYWADTTLDMTDDTSSWIIVNAAGELIETTVPPDPLISIILAEVITQGGEVVFLGKGAETQLYQSINRMQTYRYVSNGPRAVSGISTTADATPLKLDVDGGSFYIGDNLQTVTSGIGVTFTAWYRSNAPGAPWVAVPGQTLIDDEQYNDIAGGGGLAAIPGGEHTGHVLFIASTEDGPEYHVVYGQMTDAVITDLTLPTPPDQMLYNTARSGQIVVLKSAGVIAQINDVRQFAGASTGGGGGGVTAHAMLIGLAVGNDHPQYQLRTEKGAISGYCGLDASQKVAATNLPFTSTAASNVTDGLPSAGAGTEVARQNHVHFHGNLGAVDGSLNPLHSIAVAGTTPGFISGADQLKLDGLAILHASRHATGGADPVSPASIGAYTTTESDARDMIRDAGIQGDPTWTEHPDGTITVDAMNVVLFNSSVASVKPESYAIPAVLHDPPAGRSYVVVDYNGAGPGVPAQIVITDVTLIEERTVIPVITIYRTGTDLSILPWNSIAYALPDKLHLRLVKTNRFARESGLILTEDSVRKIHVGEGRIWYGTTGVDLADYVSGDPGTETVFFYHVGGVWNRSTITQYNNSQYDDGTDLQSLSAGRYAVNWIYRGLCVNHNRVAVVLGGGDYNSTEAYASVPPSVPDSLSTMTMLVGRIIVKQGESLADAVESAFDVVFPGVPVYSHNDLDGLNVGDYQHLTATQLTGLTGGSQTTLHSHAHGNQLGGALHSAVVAGGANGFMTGTDKTKLDGISSLAAALTSDAPADVTKATAGVGLATTAARADHKHDVSTGVPVSINTTNQEGDATTLARSNHVHAHGTQPGGTSHAVVVSGGSSGFMTGADKAKLDGLITNAVPDTRQIIAGAGLTGGGTLAANRTFAVLAHSDGSIAVGAGGVQVGVLASDAQHGARGGGTQHAEAVAGVSAGFISAADKTKLDGMSGVFGLNPLQSSEEGLTTNSTSSFNSKVTLVTGALTGTFRLEWTAELTVNSNIARYQVRLYNATLATELNLSEGTAGTNGIWQVRSGFIYVTLTGTSQTYAIQFASQNNSAQVSCRRARMGFFRVS